MASVPNLPIAPAVPTPNVPAAPEGEGAGLDFFAQLLNGGPLTTAIADIPADEMTLRAAPAEGEAGSDGEAAPDGSVSAEIIPLLQAQNGFPVAVVPPAQATSSGGGKPLAQGTTLQASPDLAGMAGSGDGEAAGRNTVGAAVKAAIRNIVGKPDSRPGKPDGAAPAGRGQEVSAAVAEAIATAKQSRAPEVTAARIEVAVQPNAPQTLTHPVAPATPQPINPAAAPVQGAVPDVAQLIAERQLDLANDSQWLDRLARDIARAGANDEPLRFRLHPQTLGHLQVELTQSERGTAVRLTVETEAARNLLIDAQPRLAAEARAQGVRLAGTEVDLGTAGQQSGDARRNAEERPQDIVRVVSTGPSASTSSEPAEGRSDRYA